jgi:hypothetical protein
VLSVSIRRHRVCFYLRRRHEHQAVCSSRAISWQVTFCLVSLAPNIGFAKRYCDSCASYLISSVTGIKRSSRSSPELTQSRVATYKSTIWNQLAFSSSPQLLVSVAIAIRNREACVRHDLIRAACVMAHESHGGLNQTVRPAVHM